MGSPVDLGCVCQQEITTPVTAPVDINLTAVTAMPYSTPRRKVS